MKTSQKTRTLEILRDVGVLHLSSVTPKEGSSLEELKRATEQTLLAIALLSDLKKKKDGRSIEFDAAEAASSIAELYAEIARLNEDSGRCRAQITAKLLSRRCENALCRRIENSTFFAVGKAAESAA